MGQNWLPGWFRLLAELTLLLVYKAEVLPPCWLLERGCYQLLEATCILCLWSPFSFKANNGSSSPSYSSIHSCVFLLCPLSLNLLLFSFTFNGPCDYNCIIENNPFNPLFIVCSLNSVWKVSHAM